MRDTYNDHGYVQSLAPAARTAAGNGAGVDLTNYSGAVVLIHAGAWTDGTHTFDIQESDDNVTFTSVAAGNLQGAKPVINGAGVANAVYKVGYLGTKKWLRAATTVTGATTGAVYGAVVQRSHAATKPVA